MVSAMVGPPGMAEMPEQVKWFQFYLDASQLPSWFRSKASECLQKCIAALEGLAQVVLLFLHLFLRAAEAELVGGTHWFWRNCETTRVLHQQAARCCRANSH